jgi:hypothetical protein
MPALMFHHRNPDPIRIHMPKVDDKWEPPHQAPTEIPGYQHPPLGRRNQGQHLTLELVDELHAQTGRSILLVVLDPSQLGFDSRMILHPHRRRRAIISS